MRKVELLAPGGDAPSVKAAILAGADAVYLGVGYFNARKRAVNITLPELEDLCLLAHEKDCKVYLTYNVLALEEEIKGLLDFLRTTVAAGIDAVIVQDYGLLSTIHKVFPGLEIHSSTQMTTHNRGQVQFLSQIGVKQVNLSRELSLSEIRDLALYSHHRDLKIEVFVHGAYCVSFSGQCYLSGALCENSANRGACVQPCRREYRMGRQGRDIRLRPLNLKDNSLFSSARELIHAGADSLKIEGRIKGSEYVYTAVTAWREQLNLIEKDHPPRSGDKRLHGVFNRSFSDNLLQGRLGRDSFTPDPGDKSQTLVSSVEAYHPGKKEITFTGESGLSTGQSVTILREAGQFICTGTLTGKSGNRSFYFRIDHKLMGRIQKGQQVWAQPRVFDFDKINNLLKQMTPVREKVPLRFKLQGEAGRPLTLIVSAGDKTITLTGSSDLEQADNQPTPAQRIVERLGKLGNTPFFMEHCDLQDLSARLFIPMKHLNELRQQAAALLMAPVERDSQKSNELTALLPAQASGKRLLAVAVSTKEELEQVPGEWLRLFQLPPEFNRQEQTYSLFEDYPDLIPWFPSILIGDQFEAACEFLSRCKKRVIISDNSGIAAKAWEMGIPWIAGPLMNGTNGYSLQLFGEKGATAAFLSPELNDQQIRNLTIPEGLEFWAPLVSPTLLMKSRHCLIRNCVHCGKSVMDEHCLRDCSKEAEVMDSQDNSILFLKSKGEYNSLYSSHPHLFLNNLKDTRISVFLLDFRVSHRKLKPECSLNEFIRIAARVVEGHLESQKQMAALLDHPDQSDPTGLDSITGK